MLVEEAVTDFDAATTGCRCKPFIFPYTVHEKKTVCRSKVHQLQRGVASMLGEKKRISNFASTSRQTRLCTLVP